VAVAASGIAAGSSPAAPAPSARFPPLAPKTLTRKAEPATLAKSDEDGCAAGKADACRRVADRHRGYGAVAGCGIDRGRGSPFVKVVAEDTDDDERAYTKAIAKACQLGDASSCELAGGAFASYAHSTVDARRYALRSDPEGVGILRFREKVSPEWTRVMLDNHRGCLKNESPFGCGDNEHIYFRRDVRPADDPKLSPERAQAYVEACKVTHDCDELWMMIDKNRYPKEAVAPVAQAFAETLVDGCLAGECTCGSAARFLPDDDARATDLAILGCNDGEAEGCYELARRLETGRGVGKDEARALALYHLACPDVRPHEGAPGPRMGEYSPRACDRLAELASGGTYPPKDWERTMFYAHLACPSPGSMVDHGPCVRLGRFWESNPKSTGRNGEDARDAAYGPRDGLFGQECNRPSVKEACDAFDKALASVK
jgi:hypothetical protein